MADLSSSNYTYHRLTTNPEITTIAFTIPTVAASGGTSGVLSFASSLPAGMITKVIVALDPAVDSSCTFSIYTHASGDKVYEVFRAETVTQPGLNVVTNVRYQNMDAPRTSTLYVKLTNVSGSNDTGPVPVILYIES